MLQKLALLMLGGMLWIAATHTASATVALSVPNYPTVAQLESGWNDAFVAVLTSVYGSTPTIITTTTYKGVGGEIYVVSKFTVGTINGSILGLAFDPATATSLGSGNYRYTASAGFRCDPNGSCQSCSAVQIIKQDGTKIQRCDCNSAGGCDFYPVDGQFSGTYDINPSSYSGLPNMS